MPAVLHALHLTLDFHTGWCFVQTSLITLCCEQVDRKTLLGLYFERLLQR